MMRTLRSSPENSGADRGVSTIVEYIAISSIIVTAMCILMLVMNSAFMEQPRDAVSYHSFVDIGNGVSTRIVDLYVISPYVGSNGTIRTKFALPVQVAMSGYQVGINPPAKDPIGEDIPGTEEIVVYRGAIKSTSSLAGIGATLGVGGNTTGGGLNVICYNSSAQGCPP